MDGVGSAPKTYATLAAAATAGAVNICVTAVVAEPSVPSWPAPTSFVRISVKPGARLDWSGVSGGGGVLTMFQNVQNLELLGSVQDPFQSPFVSLALPTNCSALYLLPATADRSFTTKNLVFGHAAPSAVTDVVVPSGQVQILWSVFTSDALRLTMLPPSGNDWISLQGSRFVIPNAANSGVTFSGAVSWGNLSNCIFASRVVFGANVSECVVSGCQFLDDFYCSKSITVSFAIDKSSFAQGALFGNPTIPADVVIVQDTSLAACSFAQPVEFAAPATNVHISVCTIATRLRFNAAATSVVVRDCAVAGDVVLQDVAGGAALNAVSVVGNTLTGALQVADYATVSSLRFERNTIAGALSVSSAADLALSSVFVSENSALSVAISAPGSTVTPRALEIVGNSCVDGALTLSGATLVSSPAATAQPFATLSRNSFALGIDVLFSSVINAVGLQIDDNHLGFGNPSTALRILAPSMSVIQGSFDNNLVGGDMLFGFDDSVVGVLFRWFSISNNRGFTVLQSSRPVVGSNFSDTTMEWCQFCNNTFQGQDCWVDGTSVLMQNSCFVANNVGSITVQAAGAVSGVKLNSCVFSNNSVVTGLGIFQNPAGVAGTEVTSCVFSNNTDSAGASAITIQGEKVVDNVISGNFTPMLEIRGNGAAPLGVLRNTITDNRCEISITGETVATDVSQNSVTGNMGSTAINGLGVNAVSTNTNIVTGNQASSFPGWTTFASAGYPNDLMDTGVAPVVAGVGLNRL